MGGLVKTHAAQVLLCSDGEAVAVGRRQEGQCAVPASRPSVAVGYRSLNDRIFGCYPAGRFPSGSSFYSPYCSTLQGTAVCERTWSNNKHVMYASLRMYNVYLYLYTCVRVRM